MEPISILISTAVGYMAKTIGGSKSFKEFTEDFSKATIDWLKPIFLTDEDKPKEVMADLENDPKDNLNIQAAENTLAKAIKKDPNLEEKLKSLVKEMQNKGGDITKKLNNQTIMGDGNVSIQDVTGSSININKDK